MGDNGLYEDVLRCELVGEGLSEAFQSELGGGVHGGHGEGPETGTGGDVYDATVLVGAEMGEYEAGDVHEAWRGVSSRRGGVTETVWATHRRG